MQPEPLSAITRREAPTFDYFKVRTANSARPNAIAELIDLKHDFVVTDFDDADYG